MAAIVIAAATVMAAIAMVAAGVIATVVVPSQQSFAAITDVTLLL